MTQITTSRGSNVAAPTFSIVSIIAAVCAIFSFRFGVTIGTLLAVLAIVFGVLGAGLAILPNRRGGMISVFAIGLGLIGILVAVFRLLGKAL